MKESNIEFNYNHQYAVRLVGRFLNEVFEYDDFDAISKAKKCAKVYVLETYDTLNGKQLSEVGQSHLKLIEAIDSV